MLSYDSFHSNLVLVHAPAALINIFMFVYSELLC